MRVAVLGTGRSVGAAVAAAVTAAGHELAGDGPADAVVDAATAPELPGAAVDLEAGRRALARAGAGARVVLLSSVLVYADGGERELVAAEPAVADGPLLDAELAVFASAARFLVVRAGIPLGSGTPAAACLGAPDPAGSPAWVPVAGLQDLARWALLGAEGELAGVYDAVSDLVRCGELGGRPPLGDASRRVTGAQLAAVAGPPRATWRELRDQAIASRRA